MCVQGCSESPERKAEKSARAAAAAYKAGNAERVRLKSNAIENQHSNDCKDNLVEVAELAKMGEMLAISLGDLAGVRSARSLIDVAERKHEQCLLNSKANVKDKVGRVIYWGQHKQEILTQAKALIAKEDLEGIKNIYNTYALNDDTELELIKPEIDALENKVKKRIADALESAQVQVAQPNQTEWPKPPDNLFAEQPRVLPETTKLAGQSHPIQPEQTEWPKPPDNLFVGQQRVSP